jgi:hypothetical protein
LLFDEHREDDWSLRVGLVLDMLGIRAFEGDIDERLPVGLVDGFEESADRLPVVSECCDLFMIEQWVLRHTGSEIETVEESLVDRVEVKVGPTF